MRALAVLPLAVVFATVAAEPLLAQKSPPVITRDADRDGVPDIRDRCRDTPAGTVVNASGCPVPATPAQQPARGAGRAQVPAVDPGGVIPQARQGLPTGGNTGGAPARPPVDTAAARAAAQLQARTDSLRRVAFADSLRRAITDSLRRQTVADSLGRIAAAESLRVAQVRADSIRDAEAAQAAAEAAAEAAAARAAEPAHTLTAGFAILPFMGNTNEERIEFAREVAVRFDSVLVALIEIFRNTIAQPLRGAAGPDVISSREKNRWQRCRLVYFDLQTYRAAADELAAEPMNPSVDRALQQLITALREFEAVRECDNISSMLDAPDRWRPWTSNYETSVTNYYAGWYRQLRAAHEAGRSYAMALNQVLPPANHIPAIPALQPNPPTIGGAR